MTKTGAFVLLAVLMASLIKQSFVFADQVVIKNNTGHTVCELFLAPSDSLNWTEELLNGQCLLQGREKSVTINNPSQIRRMMAVFDNYQGQVVFYGLGFAGFSYLKLNKDDAELFQWDPEKPH